MWPSVWCIHLQGHKGASSHFTLSQEHVDSCLFAPELEKVLTASHPEVWTPGGADVRPTRAMPFHASNTCNGRHVRTAPDILPNTSAPPLWWKRVGVFQLDDFFSPRPPSVPENRSESVPPNRAGTGRGGAGERGRCWLYHNGEADWWPSKLLIREQQKPLLN